MICSAGETGQCGCAVLVIPYKKVVANRYSWLTTYLPLPLYKAPELKLDEVCVVTKVSALLTITQVSCGYNFLIFSKCKYLHAKIASLATVNVRVTMGPIS